MSKEKKPSAAAMRAAPENGRIVFVHGGVAQYRDGVFYTGMEDPRWARPIQWVVEWWLPIEKDPRAEFASVVEALRKLSEWPDSYPANANIQRMREYAASRLSALEGK